ncbi:MAG: PhnA domain-containing protein [Sulfurimonas sp.]|uniref:PhnA domain-containing protein n=1 Tax=Sulfurimonas sp. TaxID=2022749 RepID=UPI00262DC485|nr:alkylphosphonate utilization protein [Sulfurimonas sp.]MDD2651996.1 PhnA domain-containing protein [Sulfurimonas sp.]MDD3451878.1 PhnA domain-containing protein [Sulfurimonas sp.]
MSIEKELIARSGGKCELCGSSEGLSVFEIAPSDGSAQKSIYLCATCKEQVENPDKMDETHFNCLNESMWSEVSAVLVMSYRLLKSLGREDLVDMMYMEEEVKAWADATSGTSSGVVVKDANGVTLNAGDSVVILKDLEVKGAGFTAKRGTTVRNITIPQDVEGHIEGRVNGTKIYLKTEFLKKA